MFSVVVYWVRQATSVMYGLLAVPACLPAGLLAGQPALLPAHWVRRCKQATCLHSLGADPACLPACLQISGLTRTASNFFIYLLITWSSSNCLGESAALLVARLCSGRRGTHVRMDACCCLTCCTGLGFPRASPGRLCAKSNIPSPTLCPPAPRPQSLCPIFAYAPVPAGLFRMVGYAGSTMVMANSVAMLILLLMVVTNGERMVCRFLQRHSGWGCRASAVPSQAVSS